MMDLPINLQEIHSIFAMLKINVHVQTDPSSCVTSSRGKHLKLLNSIALLLVTDATLGVAATTLSNHSVGKKIKIIIHIVKNRECFDVEKLYFTNFMKVVNGAELNTLPSKLIELIIKNCRLKISRRATKLAEAVEERKTLF